LGIIGFRLPFRKKFSRDAHIIRRDINGKYYCPILLPFALAYVLPVAVSTGGLQGQFADGGSYDDE
jgi:hypothetical protein